MIGVNCTYTLTKLHICIWICIQTYTHMSSHLMQSTLVDTRRQHCCFIGVLNKFMQTHRENWEFRRENKIINLYTHTLTHTKMTNLILQLRDFFDTQRIFIHWMICLFILWWSVVEICAICLYVSKVCSETFWTQIYRVVNMDFGARASIAYKICNC